MTKLFTLVAAIAGGLATLGAQTSPPKTAPTVDQILALKRAGSPEISPDGAHVAFNTESDAKKRPGP